MLLRIYRQCRATGNFSWHQFARYSVNSPSENSQLTIAKEHQIRPKSIDKQKSPSDDLLISAFKSATNPLQLLNIPTSAQYKTMAGETVVKALRTISALHRATKEQIDKCEITSHPHFELLCRRLKRCSRTLDVHDVIGTLNIISTLGIPANSEIMLILMHMLRHQLNNLSLEQIVYVDYLLDRMQPHTDLQTTVRSALPALFELQLPAQIDKDNTVELTKCLQFMASHPETTYKAYNVTKVCSALVAQKDEISLNDAREIIMSLRRIACFDVRYANMLMCHCLRQLGDAIGAVEMEKVMVTVERLVSTNMQSFPYKFQLNHFFRKCANKVVAEDLGLEQAAHLQKKFKVVSYVSDHLLGYISKKIVANIEEWRTVKLDLLLTIVQAFSNASFVPRQWADAILPALLENENLKRQSTDKPMWLQFTLQLMVLGYFDEQLISHVLNPTYLNTYLDRKPMTLFEKYKVLILYQTAAMNQTLDLQSIDKSTIERLFESYVAELSENEVQKSVQNVLGKDFVLSNIRTKYTHFMDTLVKVNRNTRQFVEFKEIRQDHKAWILLDDIVCGEDEMLVCIDTFRHSLLIRNSYVRKKGPFQLRQQQLNQLGVSVCELNLRKFNAVPDDMKLDFLSKIIWKCLS